MIDLILTYVTFYMIRYEKLQRWDDALKAYTLKTSQAASPNLLDATLGLYSLLF